MNPEKHAYMDRWLHRMLKYSQRKFWHGTIPKFPPNKLRHLREWGDDELVYINKVYMKVTDLQDEIEKQLRLLNSNENENKEVKNDEQRRRKLKNI